MVRGAQPGLVPGKSHLVQLFSFNKPRFFKRQFLSEQHVQPWSRRRYEPQEIAPGEPGAIVHTGSTQTWKKGLIQEVKDGYFCFLFFFFLTRLQFPFHPTRSRLLSRSWAKKKKTIKTKKIIIIMYDKRLNFKARLINALRVSEEGNTLSPCTRQRRTHHRRRAALTRRPNTPHHGRLNYAGDEMKYRSRWKFKNKRRNKWACVSCRSSRNFPIYGCQFKCCVFVFFPAIISRGLLRGTFRHSLSC